MPFAPGCEPMKLLAGLDVTAKAIERTAEAIGTQIAQRDQQEIARAKQLVLPVVSKKNIPKMYVLMDGAPAPASASSAACSRRPPWTRKAGLSATRTPPATKATSKPPKISSSATIRRLVAEVGSGPRSK